MAGYDVDLKEVETGGNEGNETQEGRESKGLQSNGADIEMKTMTTATSKSHAHTSHAHALAMH